ncbi:MAG: hypothetical protein QOJ59_5196 [Thermomicrobiales bacterium]|jgi:hypothetical protein|nr:hypothetical protein [Thermomicrobiales bacterium]
MSAHVAVDPVGSGDVAGATGEVRVGELGGELIETSMTADMPRFAATSPMQLSYTRILRPINLWTRSGCAIRASVRMVRGRCAGP